MTRPGMTDPSLHALVDRHADRMVALRRVLHRHPEPSWEEHASTARVAGVLAEAGLKPTTVPGRPGLVAEVGEGEPVIAFRADLDALPIDEQADLPYASEVPGMMHACGHDAHTAIAAGIAAVLAGSPPRAGTVRFVFQPAEEAMPGGAHEMVRRGTLDGVREILAFHVDPGIPAGTIGLRAGPITGASDRLRIEVVGPGGHTSRPHRTVDVVGALGRIAAELPGLLQRSIDPRTPVTVVFGRVAAGSTDNVIPSRGELGGTVRLFDIDLWRSLPPIVERLVGEIAAPLGATAKVVYDQGHPPVVNDARVIEAVAAAAAPLLDPGAIVGTEQSLGAEDFSWYLEHVPGALVRLGAGVPGLEVDLHSAEFVLDEAAISVGMLVGAASLRALLERPAG
jgi:amidohydrolase